MDHFKTQKEAFDKVLYEWNVYRENLPVSKKHFAKTFNEFAKLYIGFHPNQFKNLKIKKFIQ